MKRNPKSEAFAMRPSLIVLYIAAILSSLMLAVDVTQAQSGSQSGGQTCHLRELDLCAATLLVFTQSPSGIAVNDKEIDKQCSHLKDSNTCLNNYTKRCMTPLQREVATYAANTSMTMLNEYCTKGSQLRQQYLKHAPCLNQADRKQQRQCLRDFQTALEVLAAPDHEDATQKKLQLACCAYRRFRNCLTATVEKKCGNESVAFVDGLVRRASSRLPENICRNYKPDSLECKTLLPKPNVQPKGAKSNSIVSRLMSAYTGL